MNSFSQLDLFGSDNFTSAREEATKQLQESRSGILRSCSYVGTAQWQYVLPNKRKANSLDPFQAFEAKVSEMISDMDFAKRAGFNQTAKMFLRDAREPAPIADNSVDLVITSPPYPNNYDYADAHG